MRVGGLDDGGVDVGEGPGPDQSLWLRRGLEGARLVFLLHLETTRMRCELGRDNEGANNE